MMPSVRLVKSNGIKLAVYQAGSGPAVFLLHGFPGSAYTWRHQVPALVAAGYRVVVPDLRGFGMSDAPAPVEAYDIAHLTGDLVGLLDALGLEKAVFMGHDWGGLLAWQMPLLHPSRVAGVIGVNTPFVPHWMLWMHPDLVQTALSGRRAPLPIPTVDPIVQMREVYDPKMYVLLFQDSRAADAAMNRDPRGTLRSAYRKNLITAAEWDKLPREAAHMMYYGQPLPKKLSGSDVLTTTELDFYTKQYARNGFTPGINWYRNLSRNWKAGLDVDQTIRVPSLMVSGAEDVVLRASMADGMEAYVPDLQRHVIANCWHWTPEEQPVELNRVASSWLKRRFPVS
jgi:pimeloyl-ACP methyl ester carboxylesterase